jgi:two-component system response regulator MprA
MLPGMDGLEVTRRIRRTMNVPIIMLTAKDEVDDLVTGLNMGADDYVTKPFTFKELMARTRALLRRFGITTGDVLSFHNITLDRGTRVVTRNNEEIELTPREFDLLELLLMHPRQVLSREVILARVWGYDYEGDDNIIEVYIRHLREKLHDNPPQLIQTVRGIGYSLRG